MENKIRVLIIEDTDSDALLLLKEIQKGGFEVYYKQIEKEDQLKQELKELEWDIVFADYMLPQYDGINALKLIKEVKPDLPCIMLSGKAGEENAVEAMKAGAVDYILKDNFSRLLPALKRELNEVRIKKEKKIIEQQLKEKEEQFRESENRIRNLIEQNDDIIFTLDSKENLVSINPIGEKLITGKFERSVPIKEFLSIESYKNLRIAVRKSFLNRETFFVQEINLFSINATLLTLELILNIYYQENKIKEIFGIARNITKSKLSQNEALSKVIEAEERQKKLFAQELHDGLGALLSTINIYVGLLMKTEKSRKQRKEYLENLKSLVNEAVTDVRYFVDTLAPNVLNDFGLVTAIKSFCDKVNATSKGLIKFKEPKRRIEILKIIEINFYRIILELINNSLKYSESTKISIEIIDEKDHVILNYSDNGKGFDVNEVLNTNLSGMGIKNIIARINSLNGTCDFKSNFGSGTQIAINVLKNLNK